MKSQLSHEIIEGINFLCAFEISVSGRFAEELTVGLLGFPGSSDQMFKKLGSFRKAMH